MKQNQLSQLVLMSCAIVLAVGCQPKKPVEQTPPKAPAEAPVAPPESYESEECTDVDECSEGAAVEPSSAKTPEQAVESAAAVQSAPQKWLYIHCKEISQS